MTAARIFLSLRSHRIALSLLLPWLAVAALSTLGCGGGGGPSDAKLTGSISSSYTLIYDHIQIFRQDVGGSPKAMRVDYVRNKPSGGKEWPVQVIANWPVVKDVKKDIVAEGNLNRATSQNNQFPAMQTGTLLFDSLGDIGQRASGRFDVLFKSGDTLSGTFSGTVEALTF